MCADCLQAIYAGKGACCAILARSTSLCLARQAVDPEVYII
jgi:hypothetical protein